MKTKILIALIFLSTNLKAQTYDSDAQAFFTATGITNTTQKNAVNQLVLDFKAASIWTKMIAIYPFVGGTATTHKYNLKDPRDLDAAFRLTWEGNGTFPTHSSNGVQFTSAPQGYANWADTKIDASTLSINSAHMSFYSKTDLATQGRVDMGAKADFGFSFGYSSRSPEVYGGGSSYLFPTATTSTAYHFLMSRTSSSSLVAYKNGTAMANDDASQSNASGSFTAGNILIGSINSNPQNNGSGKICAFATVGTGLSSTESLALYNAIHTFQCALSRSVDSCTSGGGGGGTDSTGTDSTHSDTTWRHNGNKIYYNNGNVGIGTTNPAEKLSVNGNISAKKLIVTQTGWPDYVFDKGYKLPSLTEIAKFIKQHQHLPGIPSAKKIEENGLDVGDGQALLLQKMEEMTLMMIEQDKKINKQNREIRKLKKQVSLQNTLKPKK